MRRATTRWFWAEAAAVAAVSAAVAAKLALRLGQDASWDLQNYHWYNPFALLNGRVGLDLAPAMRQTYFNPLIDVPFYLMATATTPKLASAGLAAFQGMLLALTYALGRELFPARRGWRAGAAAAGCCALAVVGFCSPLSLAELGATPGDNTSGVFVLAGLLLAAMSLRRPAARGRAGRRRATLLAAAAGGLAGAAVGLKLTNAPFALALLAAVWLVPAVRPRRRVRLTLAQGAGLAAGALATGGYWWAQMYGLFGNPIFPQMNHLFASPWADSSAFTDDDFRGRGLLRQAFYPVAHNALIGTDAGGRRFGDLRLPILLGLGIACAAKALTRAPAGRILARRRRAWFIAAFVAVAYAAWVVVFSIERYALLLEVLAPLAAVCMLVALGLRRAPLAAASAAAVLLMALTYHAHPNARVFWSDDLFDVTLPAGDYDGSLVVIASHQPVGFVLPSFPPSTRFVRVAGNLYYEQRHESPASRHDKAMGRAIRREVDGHDGPIYVLFTDADGSAAADAGHFGLAFDVSAGREVTGKIGPDATIRLAPAARR